MHQVIIVGAGPAGAYLAYLLSRQGINVLILEKKRLPRDKPCGGGISPKVVKLLDSDFDLSSVIEDTVDQLVFTHRWTRPLTVVGERPIVYMVSRERFDAFLVTQAQTAGAEVMEETRVTGIEVNDEAVHVHAGGRVWRGQVLVGADGALSVVARTLGLAGRKRNTVTMESQIPLPIERMGQYRGTVKVDYGLIPRGYTWVFPKTDHLSVGVGTISPQLKGLKFRLGEVIALESQVNPASVPMRGWTIPISPYPEELQGGRALVIGDAAGLADAFTGEGIYAALYSASLAAEVIAEQITRQRPNLEMYTGLIQAKMGSELANAYRLTRWFYPVSGLVHRLLHRNLGLATDLIRVIAGELSYTEYFNVFRQSLRGRYSIDG